jgi:AcrR family transcriptional regulator
MAAPKRRRTPTGDVRLALVDAAERVLVRDGPTGVTVRAVAHEADVAPMGVYNHLGGKQGLTNALLERGFEGLRAAVADTPGGSPLDRLGESGRGYRKYALSHAQHYSIMFDQPAPPEAHIGGGAFEALADHVRSAMDAGYVRAADPYAIALQIWCTVHGRISLELRGFIDPATADESYEQLLEFILRALPAPSEKTNGGSAT